MTTKLIITQTAIQHCALGCYVILDAQGPRGGGQEYTVRFDRRGTLLNALRTAPDSFFYRSPEEIPQAIAEAARQVYDDHDT